MSNTSPEKFVVFVDEKFASGMSVAECMSTVDRTCDKAETIFGAVEMFTDFTLRSMPEMIFVAVDEMPKELEAYERTFAGLVEGSNVRVFGLEGGSKRLGRNVAHSLGQLEALIKKSAASH
jgi:hypothetical protein